MSDYMHANKDWFCYGYETFRRLDVAAISRRYDLGEGGWLDEQADAEAERALRKAEAA